MKLDWKDKELIKAGAGFTGCAIVCIIIGIISIIAGGAAIGLFWSAFKWGSGVVVQLVRIAYMFTCALSAFKLGAGW